MKKVEIYTDGACSGNPGPGGWAAILIYEDHKKEIFGGNKDTTNNRMEMSAVIEALKILKEPCNVTIYSDSQYVCNSMNRGWVKSWKSNNWRKSNGELAKNVDLWEEMLNLSTIHELNFMWIKGHAGNIYNERCDALAVRAIPDATTSTIGGL